MIGSFKSHFDMTILFPLYCLALAPYCMRIYTVPASRRIPSIHLLVNLRFHKRIFLQIFSVQQHIHYLVHYEYSLWLRWDSKTIFQLLQNQLMRKRINLPVDKLITKSTKPPKQNQQKACFSKTLTFQQLYQLARKQPHNTHHPITQCYSANASQQISESLKSSVNTPQNSNRNCQRNRDISDKLNRSLEAKSDSIQKYSRPIRSFSSEKRLLVQQWKKQNNLKDSKQLRNIKEGKENKKINSSKSQIQEFQSQFSSLISQLDHKGHAHLRETECFLSIQETFKLMKQLHYLRKIEDEKYLVKIWQQLQGETYGGIPSQNLYQFFSYINHYNPTNLYPPQKLGKDQEISKKIIINSNLKIVASQQKKLEIYEDYLALRVNRILYGSQILNQAQDSNKKKQRKSNIKIIDDEPQQLGQGETIPQGNIKTLFTKKPASQNEVASNVPAKRAVRLRSAAIKNKKQEQAFEKQTSEETICYSDISDTKESGQNLTSNQSQSSIQTSEANQQTLERKPILSIDVNLGEGLSQKLLVYEGESALDVSKRLVEKYNIDEALRVKFETMLNGHIRNLLWRIEQVSEQMFSDRQE